MNNVHMNTFETCNRRLEQFLFVHDIHFMEWYKNEDGLTIWRFAGLSRNSESWMPVAVKSV